MHLRFPEDRLAQFTVAYGMEGANEYRLTGDQGSLRSARPIRSFRAAPRAEQRWQRVADGFPRGGSVRRRDGVFLGLHPQRDRPGAGRRGRIARRAGADGDRAGAADRTGAGADADLPQQAAPARPALRLPADALARSGARRAADGLMTALFVPPLPTAAEPAGPWRTAKATRRDALQLFPPAAYEQDVVVTSMLGRNRYLLNSEAGIHRVLIGNAKNYRRTPASIRILRPIAGEGLILSEGETWRRQRQTIAPALAPRIMPMLARHVVTATERAVAVLAVARARSMRWLSCRASRWRSRRGRCSRSKWTPMARRCAV